MEAVANAVHSYNRNDDHNGEDKAVKIKMDL